MANSQADTLVEEVREFRSILNRVEFRLSQHESLSIHLGIWPDKEGAKARVEALEAELRELWGRAGELASSITSRLASLLTAYEPPILRALEHQEDGASNEGTNGADPLTDQSMGQRPA